MQVSPVTCSTCGGVYPPLASDGTPSVHVCAPITEARVERDGSELTVLWADVRDTDRVLETSHRARTSAADTHTRSSTPTKG